MEYGRAWTALSVHHVGSSRLSLELPDRLSDKIWMTSFRFFPSWKVTFLFDFSAPLWPNKAISAFFNTAQCFPQGYKMYAGSRGKKVWKQLSYPWGKLLFVSPDSAKVSSAATYIFSTLKCQNLFKKTLFLHRMFIQNGISGFFQCFFFL